MYPHTRIYSVSVSVVFVLIYKNKTGRRQDSKTVNENNIATSFNRCCFFYRSEVRSIPFE